MVRLQQLLENSKLTLIVSLPANDTALFEAALSGGADAIKAHMNTSHRASGNQFGSLQDNLEFVRTISAASNVPIGVVPGDDLGKVTKQDIDQLAALGVDFISLYAHHAPAWLLHEQSMFKLLAVNGEYSADETRSLTSLNIDMLEASIMKPEEYGMPLSIRDLASYKALADLTSKPIVVPTQKAIHPLEVVSLYETGVKAVMIGAVVTGSEPESVYRVTKQFKEQIELLK